MKGSQKLRWKGKDLRASTKKGFDGYLPSATRATGRGHKGSILGMKGHIDVPLSGGGYRQSLPLLGKFNTQGSVTGTVAGLAERMMGGAGAGAKKSLGSKAWGATKGAGTAALYGTMLYDPVKSMLGGGSLAAKLTSAGGKASKATRSAPRNSFSYA